MFIFLTSFCLKRLFEEPDFLEKVNAWIGISVGAAIALLLVVGYTIDNIIDICLNFNLVDDILSIDLEEAKQKLGFIKNKSVEDRLKYYINEKFGYIPSLRQLFMLTGKELHLVTFNLDNIRPEFLNRNTEPEISCVEAAMMSMAIPILMQPRKYKGEIYIDGAIGAPYPVLDFDNGMKILGLFISSEEDLYCSDKKPANFIYRLIQASMKILRDINIKYASENVKHISLKTEIRDTTGLSTDIASRQYMIEQGYKCAEEFLKINRNPEKYKLDLSENEEIPFENN